MLVHYFFKDGEDLLEFPVIRAIIDDNLISQTSIIPPQDIDLLGYASLGGKIDISGDNRLKEILRTQEYTIYEDSNSLINDFKFSIDRSTRCVIPDITHHTFFEDINTESEIILYIIQCDDENYLNPELLPKSYSPSSTGRTIGLLQQKNNNLLFFWIMAW
jgi:hypothetical protein